MRIAVTAGLLTGATFLSALPAMAEEAPALQGSGEPIIVTARQRPEKAQDVPAALSVVGRQWLEQSYTLNTQGLTALVPALNYSSASPRNTAFTIRAAWWR